MMKKISIICLIIMSTTVYSKDFYSTVTGKWTLDLKATKELPEVKKMLKDKEQSAFLHMMLEACASSTWEFKKNSMLITAVIEGKKEAMPPVKLKVVKNTANSTVIETVEKDKIQLTKKGKNILIQTIGGVNQGPPMVLKKIKTK